MKFSSFAVIFTSVVLSASVSAAPTSSGSELARRQGGNNLNEGSSRLVSQVGDFAEVDGIKFDNADVACQVACALDERDCVAAGTNPDTCRATKVGCQSGNGLNGQSALLNNSTP
ncbi:hypothetical protein M422DRAFT_27877 [Sphaerobolus stellatus SS14]|nr:hypothetical protein M422DRAFT_27877 [Sphaerobolus stellatus SS14]